jgi:hypothetical protein
MSLATAIATDSTLLTLDKKLRQLANVPAAIPTATLTVPRRVAL